LGQFVNIDRDIDLVKSLNKEISIKEVIDYYQNKNIKIRQSTMDLYEKIRPNENMVVAEVKHSSIEIRKMLVSHNIEGANQSLQNNILKKTGTNNYLGFQVLASQLSNWNYIAVGGVCSIFSLVPVKCLYMAERLLLDDAEEFLQATKIPEPIILRKSLCKGPTGPRRNRRTEDEEYVENHLSEHLEQLLETAKQPHERPQVI